MFHSWRNPSVLLRVPSKTSGSRPTSLLQDFPLLLLRDFPLLQEVLGVGGPGGPPPIGGPRLDQCPPPPPPGGPDGGGPLPKGLEGTVNLVVWPNIVAGGTVVVAAIEAIVLAGVNAL
jgi:hypothetical protein